MSCFLKIKPTRYLHSLNPDPHTPIFTDANRLHGRGARGYLAINQASPSAKPVSAWRQEFRRKQKSGPRNEMEAYVKLLAAFYILLT